MNLENDIEKNKEKIIIHEKPSGERVKIFDGAEIFQVSKLYSFRAFKESSKKNLP